jgi:hypothetical protein
MCKRFRKNHDHQKCAAVGKGSETLNRSKDDTIYRGAHIDDEQVMEKNRGMLLHQTVDLKKMMTKWNCRQPTQS